MIITPETFRDAFLKQYELMKSLFLSSWTLNKIYTDNFLGTNSAPGFIHKLSEQLKLKNL